MSVELNSQQLLSPYEREIAAMFEKKRQISEERLTKMKDEVTILKQGFSSIKVLQENLQTRLTGQTAQLDQRENDLAEMKKDLKTLRKRITHWKAKRTILDLAEARLLANKQKVMAIALSAGIVFLGTSTALLILRQGLIGGGCQAALFAQRKDEFFTSSAFFQLLRYQISLNCFQATLHFALLRVLGTKFMARILVHGCKATVDKIIKKMERGNPLKKKKIGMCFAGNCGAALTVAPVMVPIEIISNYANIEILKFVENFSAKMARARVYKLIKKRMGPDRILIA